MSQTTRFLLGRIYNIHIRRKFPLFPISKRCRFKSKPKTFISQWVATRYFISKRFFVWKMLIRLRKKKTVSLISITVTVTLILKTKLTRMMFMINQTCHIDRWLTKWKLKSYEGLARDEKKKDDGVRERLEERKRRKETDSKGRKYSICENVKAGSWRKVIPRR